MKSTKLIGLAAIALALVAVAFLVTKQSKEAWSDDITGHKVFPDLDLSKVKAITVKDQNAETTLKEISGKWVVAERANYSADFETLRQLVTKLSEMSILKQVKATPNGFAELKLLSPEANKAESGETGRLLKLMTADKNLLGSVIIGKTHRAPDRSWKTGSYIRVPESGLVALVEGSFFSVKSDPAKWLDKNFVEIGKIKKMSRFDNSADDDASTAEWKVARDNKDAKLKLQSELSAGKAVNKDALEKLSNALSYFRFKDVAAGENRVTSDNVFGASSTFAITDFDNVKTTLTVGTKTGANRYVKLNQTKLEPPENEPDAENNTSEQAKNENNDPAEDEEEAKKSEEPRKLREVVSEHIYLVPESQIKGILVTRDDLLQAKLDEETKNTEEKGTTD